MSGRPVSVVELHGDGISPELSESVHLVADLLPFEVRFRGVDLSLANREQAGDAVFEEADEAMRALRTAIKYPTATEGESPNRRLRDLFGFSVIHRPVTTFTGVENNFKETLDIDVVRVATGGTYGDRGRRIGVVMSPG